MIDSSQNDNQRPWLAWVLGLFGAALMTAILLPLLAADRWWIQSLTFPQVQFAVLLAAVAVAIAFLLDLR